MAWNDLANNQGVSDTNLKNAVDTGVFAAGGTSFPSPTENKEVTKTRCSGYITVPNPNYASFLNKADNQVVVKQDIYDAGDFTLDPLPSYYRIESVSCTGIPSFSYPITAGNTTLPYNGVIPSQTISVSITYIGFDDPPIFDAVRISLYVESVLVDSQYVSVYGGSASVYLPFSVPSPTPIRIAVDTGYIPTPPSSFSFSGIGVNNVAVSKNTGQYQIVTTGKSIMGSTYFHFATEAGWICRSADYGANWTRIADQFNTWRRIAISDNGQYAVAIPNSGYPVISSNYGANWSTLTSAGSRSWTGVAISETGQYITLTAFDAAADKLGTQSYILRSTNFGSSFAIPSFNSSSWSFMSVAMDQTGQYQVANKWYGRVYYSSNYGANWTDYSFQYYMQDVKYKKATTGARQFSLAAIRAVPGSLSSQWFGSTNDGASWSSVATFNFAILHLGGEYTWHTASLYSPNSSRPVQIESDAAPFPTPPIATIENLGNAQYWQCCDGCYVNASYMLAGSTSGLYRSTAGITGTWSPL